ncbi:MAG: VPLPA-CTERM sorting domain-containing protein [Gammaproteobacteria bacterium]
MIKPILKVSGLIAFLSFGSVAHAVTVALEDFEGGANGWTNEASTGVNEFASGGHDGGAYISTVNDIATNDANFGSALIQFRCPDDCSNNIFQGDWIGQGVIALEFWFRHNSAIDLRPYIRIPALPGNRPAASALPLPVVAPNVWTKIVLEIDENNPEFISFGGGGFDGIFSDPGVSRLQPGIFFDPEIVYNESSVKFDIDDVSLTAVPVPAAVWLFGSALAGLGWMKRRQ